MENRLELKHLIPYLLHGLEFYVEHENGTRLENWKLNIDTNLRQVIEFQNKPILKPLSDLTKEVEVNGEKFVPYETGFLCDLMTEIESLDTLCEYTGCIAVMKNIPYNLVNELISWHFDVFGLIEKGLAIDINTLEK